MPITYILDVGIRLRSGDQNNGFGFHEEWTAVNDRLHKAVNDSEIAAGTGFGVRDMQWSFDTVQEAIAARNTLREEFKDQLDYDIIEVTDSELEEPCT